MERIARVPKPHPMPGFAVNREDFAATHSQLKVTVGEFGERREIHVTTRPKSPGVRRALGSLLFRIVDDRLNRPTDASGRTIVGGLNAVPEPIHAVLAIAPATLDLINQRLSGARRLVISICPAGKILEWRREEALLIYEASFMAD